MSFMTPRYPSMDGTPVVLQAELAVLTETIRQLQLYASLLRYMWWGAIQFGMVCKAVRFPSAID